MIFAPVVPVRRARALSTRRQNFPSFSWKPPRRRVERRPRRGLHYAAPYPLVSPTPRMSAALSRATRGTVARLGAARASSASDLPLARRVVRDDPWGAHLQRRAFAESSPPNPGIFEFRTHALHPSRVSEYLAACAEHAPTRARLDPGYVCSWRVSAGANPDEITHLHHYPDYDARDAALAAMDADPAWRAFHAAASPAVASRASEIYLPAAACFAAAGVEGAPADAVRLATRAASVPEAAGSNPGAGRGVFEVRTYQLELGYNPIPKLVAHMAEGLPSKLASDPNRVGRLVGMFYSDVGGLNRFVEVWRYPSFQDHIRVREAARTAEKWRETIGAIAPMVQMFDTKLCVPTENF